jgi:type I restriction enzyme S subunit
MERYSEYKDCGVHWLGEIPSHWEVVPLKYYTDIIMGQSPSGDDIKDNGHLLFMQGNAEFGRKYPSPTSYCDNCNKQSRVGDILMSVRAPVGALNVSDKVYGIGRGLCSIKPVGIKLDYLWYYLIVARQGFKEVSTGSTYDSVSTDTLRSIRLVLPTQKEQQAIACYLDSVTDKIDEAIAQQQRMIDLLNERKQIIINNAVTKGLNIKAAMKDSGVDWIGEIPEHWDIKRGKFLFDIINEYSSTGEEEL